MDTGGGGGVGRELKLVMVGEWAQNDAVHAPCALTLPLCEILLEMLLFRGCGPCLFICHA